MKGGSHPCEQAAALERFPLGGSAETQTHA